MKKARTVSWVLIVLIVLSLIVFGCSKQDAAEAEPDTASSEETQEDPVEMKIGILTMGLHQTYFVSLSQGYKDMAKEFPGVDVEVVEIDPKNDAAQQVSAIENFMSMDVDGIIITAIDPEVVNPVIGEAMRKGIRVLSHYNVLGTQDLRSGISTYGMGFVAGQSAAKWINDKLGGKAEVALLIWDKTEFDIDRTKGMKDALKTYAPNATVVAEQAADSIEQGLYAAETILQAHPNVKVFVCYNDDGGLGALGAVEGANLATDDFGIFGVNASPEALSKIKNGTVFRGTASIDPYHHGQLEMEMAVRLIRGDFLPSSMEITPVAVTAENVDQFIE